MANRNDGSRESTGVTQQINGSVVRAFAILGLFTDARTEVTAAVVARELGLNAVTAHRFLKTLEVIGALVPVSRGVYRLGYLFVDLGDRAMHHRVLADTLQPVLDRMTGDLREASMAAVLDGDMVVCIARAFSGRTLSVDVRVGTRMEAYCTSQGKVWLASLDDSSLGRYLETVRLDRLTDHTITDRNALRAEVELVRNQGFALNDSEREEGLRTIAVPLKALNGRMIAGFSVFGPESRMTDAFMDVALARLREAVGEAQHLLYGSKADIAAS